MKGRVPFNPTAAPDDGAWAMRFGKTAKPNGASAGRNSQRSELLQATALTPENHDWLWKGWIARTELHVIAGPPGVGKTTIVLSIAAIVTRGGEWPDGTTVEPDNVVIWSGEDQPQKTLLPRFLAMNGDPSRLYFVGNTTDKQTGALRFFDPATDLLQLQSAILDKLGGNVALLVLDPISAAIIGDSHKNAEVRRSFLPLLAMAKAQNCAMLGVSHFAKASETRAAIERVLGSIAFTAGPRVVLAAIRPHDGSLARRLVRIKSNIGPDGGGWEYHLHQVPLYEHEHDGEIIVAQSADFEPVMLEGSARELLAVEQPPSRGEPALKSAKELLADMLTNSNRRVTEIKAETKQAGISWRTMEKAKSELGVKSIKEEGKFDGAWTWSLPDTTSPRPDED